MGFYSGVGGRLAPFDLALRTSGFVPEVDIASTPSDVWDLATPTSPLYPWPAAAAVTSIVSSSAADAGPSGAGARVVRVSGLTSSLLPISEDVVLSGTTPVVLVNRFYRVNSASVLSAGSPNAPVGNVDVRHPGPVIIARIRALAGRSQMALGTVPAVPERPGRLPYLTSWRGSVLRQRTAAVDLLLLFRVVLGGGPWVPVGRFAVNSQGSSVFDLNIDPPQVLPLGIDLRVVVEETTTNNVAIASNFDLAWIHPRAGR